MPDRESHTSFDAILASSVHDMKNSINMLTSSLEDVLAQAGNQGMPGLEKMTQMLYESRRVSNHLMQLLSIYKIDRSAYPVEIEQHDVAEVCQEIILQSQSLLRSSTLGFDMTCPEGLYWYFDRELVASAVSGAINNATRYARSQVALIARETEGSLEIRVEDDGAGYPQALLQSGTAMAQGVDFASGSTGLGLHFASRIARLHQEKGRAGHAFIENGGTFGGGCFVLRLP